MAKKKNGEDSACSQKYGVPSYGAAWVPTNNIFDKQKPMENDEQDSELSSSWLVFCGGGGEGRSGIPNSLLLAQFDSNSLSPNPNGKIHPSRGDGVIIHFLKVADGLSGAPRVLRKTSSGLKSSREDVDQFEDVGQQLAMTFSIDGSATCFVGGEVIGQFNLGFIIGRLDQDLFIIDQDEAFGW
ncbi:hypothetical protein IFM89_018980 [Coptis chinensis]|uniref:Uncharacterized protein n=1 Tax=Coptis chinensis TaxID=261450 RepID=A0A835LWA0_9MAGN|nr:hypothetical protein IFM89_018980 [Coptis chinensis]